MDPELVLFEMQVCPSELRFAMTPGQPALFGYKPAPEARPRTVALAWEGNEHRFKSVLESLSWLLIANNVVDSPQHDGHRAFDSKYMNESVLHLAIAFADGQKWACVYPMAELPENLGALIEQCKYLGHRELETAVPGRDEPSAAETAAVFSFETDGGTDKPVARVQVSRSGEIEVNGTAMRPGDFFEALHVLRRLGGDVHYYEEPGVEDRDPGVLKAERFVLDTVRALGLPLKRCPVDAAQGTESTQSG